MSVFALSVVEIWSNAKVAMEVSSGAQTILSVNSRHQLKKDLFIHDVYYL